MLHRKRQRANQLWVASVITAAILITGIYLFIMIAGFEAAKAEPLAPTAQQTLPQKCSHLRMEPDPKTWDEETDSYPRNHAWESCMGVGRK